MPTLHTYDYAIVRVVPRVERGEFINAGVLLWCKSAGYLMAGIELDEARLLALAPAVDVHSIRATLATFPALCAGGPAAGALRHLSARERFDWLVAPRSTSIQMSPVHSGRCDELETALQHLLDRMVRVTR